MKIVNTVNVNVDKSTTVSECKRNRKIEMQEFVSSGAHRGVSCRSLKMFLKIFYHDGVTITTVSHTATQVSE